MNNDNIVNHVDLFWGNDAVAALPGEKLARHWNWLKAQTGNTHPGALVPFGWVSALPYSGAYPTGYGRCGCSSNGKPPQISDRDYAAGITHFHPSGTGFIVDFYNYMLVTPCSASGNPSRLSELTDKIAEPGYFAGTLKHYKTDFELTATAFAALHRYKFHDNSGTVKIDCAHVGLYFTTERIRFFHCERADESLYSGFFTVNGTTVHYAVKISAEIADSEICNGIMNFEVNGSKAEIALGFSLVSEAEAKERACTAAGISFDSARQTAKSLWQKQLEKIKVDFAGEADKTLFYSALYHSLVKPVDAGTEFTDFQTMWDIYRTQLPLMMMVDPGTSKRMLRSMLDIISKNGYFPCCKMMSNTTRHEMQATALVIYTLADGFFRRLLTKEDYPELKAAFTSQFEYSDLTGKSFTHLLDLAGAYHSASLVAESCGDTESADNWKNAAKIWKNAYDPATGLMRKDSVYYEGTNWNYSFRPHFQMAERIELAGGKAAFEALLDKFFGFGCTDTYDCVRPIINDRFEGMNNESDMETPAAYLWCGRADKQAEIHDTIRRYMFLNGPGGCPGNNDSGGLSSWYIWSCLGLYPQTGTPYFLLTTPLANKAEIDLEGKTLTIEVNRESADSIYPAGYEFNGTNFKEPYIKLETLLAGGVLKFNLADQPQPDSIIPDWL